MIRRLCRRNDTKPFCVSFRKASTDSQARVRKRNSCETPRTIRTEASVQRCRAEASVLIVRALQRDDTVGNHALLHQGLYAAKEDLACDRRNETLSYMGIKGIKHKPQLLTLLNEVAWLDAAV